MKIVSELYRPPTHQPPPYSFPLHHEPFVTTTLTITPPPLRCVCCSVRADLSRVLKEQLKRNQRAKKRDAKQAGAGSGVGGLTKSFARSVLAFLDRKLIGDDDDDDKAKDKDKDGKKKKNGDAKDGDKGSTENDDGRAFDAIIVETTGVALVSPIIQLFFADFEVRKQTRLDAVRHIEREFER